MKYFIMCILFTITFLSCVYSEGRINATKTFELMTSTETIMYNAVEDEWGQYCLKDVRAAIRGRRKTPNEDALPFADIVNVIKANNDITLIPDANVNSEYKKVLEANKWSSIDPEWYNKITTLENPLSESEKKEDIGSVKNDSVNIPVNNLEILPVKPEIPQNDLIDSDEYNDLYYEIKHCPEAVEAFNDIVRDENRPLTKQDVVLIIRESKYCTAREISNKLN